MCGVVVDPAPLIAGWVGAVGFSSAGTRRNCERLKVLVTAAASTHSSQKPMALASSPSIQVVACISARMACRVLPVLLA